MPDHTLLWSYPGHDMVDLMMNSPQVDLTNRIALRISVPHSFQLLW